MEPVNKLNTLRIIIPDDDNELYYNQIINRLSIKKIIDYNNEAILNFSNEPLIESNNETQTESDNETQTESDNEIQTESDNEIQTESDNETQTNSVNEPDIESDTKPNTELVTNSVNEPYTEEPINNLINKTVGKSILMHRNLIDHLIFYGISSFISFYIKKYDNIPHKIYTCYFEFKNHITTDEDYNKHADTIAKCIEPPKYNRN